MKSLIKYYNLTIGAVMKSLNGPVRSRLANDEKACTNFTDLYTVYVLHIQKVECLGKKFPEKKTTTEVGKPD